jgi:hypothetical protein
MNVDEECCLTCYAFLGDAFPSMESSNSLDTTICFLGRATIAS